jgi:hypothetical protein
LWILKRNAAGLLLALVPAVAAAQTPADNLHQLLQLFDRVAYRIVEQLPRDSATAIFVRPPANGRLEERFFFSRLVTILSDTLPVPVLVEPVDSLTTLALTYQLHRCEIVYRPSPHQRFLRRTSWQRDANIFVEVSAYNLATRQVRFQKIWEETATDSLDKKYLPGLEASNLPFTLGRWESARDGFHWLEAALITSATGIIVYLFYSLRSR